MAVSWGDKISATGDAGARCDLIIPVWNQLSYTRGCLESIRRHTPESVRLIVVDNGSTDGTGDYLRELPSRLGKPLTVITNSANLGYVRAVNQGLQVSRAPYVCLLNNDTVVTEGWLSGLLAAAGSRPEVGLLNPLGNVGGPWSEARWRRVREQLARGAGKIEELEHCSGFCLFIKREVLERVGLFDETFGMGNFEDNDYCERARQAGFLSAKAHDVWVHHIQNRSFDRIPGWGEKISEPNRERLREKWPLRPAVTFVGVPAVPRAAEAFRALFRKAYAFARSRCRVAVVSGLPAPLRPESFWEDLGLSPHANIKTYFLPPLPAANRSALALHALLRCRRLARKKGYRYVYLSGEGARISALRRFFPLAVLWESSTARDVAPGLRRRLREGDRIVLLGDGVPGGGPEVLRLAPGVGSPLKVWDPDVEEFLSRLEAAGA